MAFVTDETGLVKEVTQSDKPPTVRRYREQNRQKAVEAMCFAPTAEGEVETEVRVVPSTPLSPSASS